MVALAAVAIVVFCWLGVLLLGALPGDAKSAAEVREAHLGWAVLAPPRALDWLGRPPQAAALVVLAAAWVWRAIGWRHAILVCASGAVVGLAWLIKLGVGRGRPDGAGLADPSFPSGHTAWAMAVFGTVAVLAFQHRRWPAAVLSIAIAGAMGPSRVLLGVHWLSDVVAGYAVGIVWLVALLLAGLPFAERDRLAGRRRSRRDS